MMADYKVTFRAANETGYAVILANAMERAGAQVISVAEAAGSWYVWCRYDTEFHNQVNREIDEYFVADLKRFKKHWAQMNAVNKRDRAAENKSAGRRTRVATK